LELKDAAHVSRILLRNHHPIIWAVLESPARNPSLIPIDGMKNFLIKADHISVEDNSPNPRIFIVVFPGNPLRLIETCMS
jgi:hypothetical protein